MGGSLRTGGEPPPGIPGRPATLSHDLGVPDHAVHSFGRLEDAHGRERDRQGGRSVCERAVPTEALGREARLRDAFVIPAGDGMPGGGQRSCGVAVDRFLAEQRQPLTDLGVAAIEEPCERRPQDQIGAAFVLLGFDGMPDRAVDVAGPLQQEAGPALQPLP